MSNVVRYSMFSAPGQPERDFVLAADYDALANELTRQIAISNAMQEKEKLAQSERIKLVIRIADLEAAPKRLIGWRTDDYLWETSDRAQALNWEPHKAILPIFDGDPHTKLEATLATLTTLTGQPQQGEPCQGENCGTTTGQHSRECIEEAARDQGWIPTEEDFKGYAKAEQPVIHSENGPNERAALSTALFNALESYEASRGKFSRKDQKIHAKQCELIRQHAAQLLAGQPAALAPAAAVVMPERMTTIPEGKTISYAAGYEDALDAVASLNRTVSLELLEQAIRYLDEKSNRYETHATKYATADQLRAILAGGTK